MQTSLSNVTEHIVEPGSFARTELKIIDTSKRAYDTSIEATRALELVLQKDPKRCKHLCARLQSVVGSMWIMMLKRHGSPPVTGLNF